MRQRFKVQRRKTGLLQADNKGIKQVQHAFWKDHGPIKIDQY